MSYDGQVKIDTPKIIRAIRPNLTKLFVGISGSRAKILDFCFKLIC